MQVDLCFPARQVTDPYLNLFRGLVPPLLGTIDFVSDFLPPLLTAVFMFTVAGCAPGLQCLAGHTLAQQHTNTAHVCFAEYEN